MYDGILKPFATIATRFLKLNQRYFGVLLLIYGMISVFAGTQAQQVQVIKGYVKDSHAGKPLPEAHVYFDGTMLGTTTNRKGYFELTIPFDVAGLAISKAGYTTYGKIVYAAQWKDKKHTFNLAPQPKIPGAVNTTAMKGPGKERMVELFKEYFLGQSRNSYKCTILNPEALYLALEEGAILKAYTVTPLKIENKALGYMLYCSLDQFEADLEKNTVIYEGGVRFEALEGRNKDKVRNWMKNRKMAYEGSFQHFINWLLCRDGSEKQPFSVYGKGLVPAGNTAYSRPHPMLFNFPFEKLADGNYRLKLKDPPYVVFHGEQEEKTYFDYNIKRLGNNFERYEADDIVGFIYEGQGYYLTQEDALKFLGEAKVGKQSSWIVPGEEPLKMSHDGYILNPEAVTLGGYWHYEKIADQLPLEYTLRCGEK